MTATSEPTAAIDQLLNEGAWTALQRRVLIVLMSLFMVDGIDNQLMGVSIPFIIEDWGTSRDQFAIVLAAGWAGAVLGTIGCGVLGDRIGRKWTIIGTVLLFGVMTFTTALARHVETLAVLRFLAGIGLGGFTPPALSMIAEYTPARYRGRAIAGAIFCVLLGVSASGLLTGFIAPHFGWKTLYFFSGLLPLVFAIVLMRFLPESPSYLARFPQRRQELIELLQRMNRKVAPEAVPSVATAAVKTRPVSRQISVLFGRDFWQSTLGLWGCALFCHLSVATFLNWIPTMLASVGFSLRLASAAPSAWGVGGMFGTLIAGWLIEKFGGRATMRCAAAGSLIGAIVLMTGTLDPGQGAMGLIGVLVWEGVLLTILTTSIFAYATELYPALARSTGIGFSTTVGRLGSFSSSYIGVAVLDLGGPRAFFAISVCAMSLTLLCTLFMKRINLHQEKNAMDTPVK